MTATQRARIKSLLAQAFEEFSGRVSDWCSENVRFNEPKLSGAFNFDGREYLREPMDSWQDRTIKDWVLCFATRTGKTRILFAWLAFIIKWNASRVLYVMPNTHGTGGAQNVARTRAIPMMKATRCIAENIPRKSERHNFKTLQQILCGSIIDWAGSNSPANLAGNPCNVVIQDEVDKYRRLGDREADPSKLADERCKEFSNPKRVKVSTPTLVSGLIWQELLKTDIRRRFMPCPHCGQMVIFAWSENYTVLPKTGSEAYVKWDQSAKVDGVWDLERVMATAHAECPNAACKGQIREEHKEIMDKTGEWRPTQKGTPGMCGYHLPSMYSQSVETSFGELAKKFLTAKNSIQGLQGFINSDLAEPYQAQDSIGTRSETVIGKIEVTAEWLKIITVDCQAKAPYFWYVIRAWNGADSEGMEAGHFDQWADLRAKQGAIQDVCVWIDSGFGSRSDAEVYAECARWSVLQERDDKLPLLVGWMPCKGFPAEKRWKDDKGLLVPYCLREADPYLGKLDAGKVAISLFEFSADFFQDVLERLRTNRTKAKWTVPKSMATEEYFRHLDGAVKAEKFNRFNGKTEHRWTARHRYWPDHLRDAEKMQCAAAAFFGRLPLDG